MARDVLKFSATAEPKASLSTVMTGRGNLNVQVTEDMAAQARRAAGRAGVAFVCHPYHRGGVTRWMVDAAAEWRRRGESAWFVVPRLRRVFHVDPDRPAVVDLLQALPERERPTLVTPVVGRAFEFGTEEFRARIYADSLAAAVPPGVPTIVSDDPAAWLAAATVADRFPFVGILHADDDAYYDYARRHPTEVSAWVCVSSRVAAGLRRLRLASDAPSTVIACGTPLPPLARRDVRSATVRLVWIGRVSERQKRVSDLPRVAARLRASGVPFVLDVVGDGDALESLRMQTQQAGVDGAVRFHGWCNARRVAEVLAVSDVMLLPSNFEGMPVAAMEAMGTGCGVIASRASGLEEFAATPEAPSCLWIHDVGDVEAIAAAVCSAAAVPVAQRAGAARRLAEREFAIEVCVDRYQRFFATLPVSGGRRARKRHFARSSRLVSHTVAAARLARKWLGPRTGRAEKGFASRRIGLFTELSSVVT